jgi:hypothetical protein
VAWIDIIRLVKSWRGSTLCKEMKMNAEDQSIWNRLKAFHIGDETAIFGFEHRLARENGWNVDFAERVIEEYKRFMFLAVRSGHRVTPSEEIDQV